VSELLQNDCEYVAVIEEFEDGDWSKGWRS